LLAFWGTVYGLIDHNDFEKITGGVILTGLSINTETCSYNYAWQGGGCSISTLAGGSAAALPYEPGGVRNLFIEDNTFTGTGAGITALDTSYSGGRLIFRHNILNNAMLYAHWTSGNSVNSLWWEVYNNTFTNGGGTLPYPMRIHGGGTGLIYNNTISGYSGNNIQLGEGRNPAQAQSGAPTGYCDGTNPWDGNAGDPAAPGWPCLSQTGRDAGKSLAQIQAGDKQASFPLYMWSNGPQARCSNPSASGGACDNSFNVGVSFGFNNYFKSTPHPNGDVDYSRTTSQPTGAGTHTLNYTPYQYPHPLQGSGGGADTTPPTVAATNPTTAATNVSINTNIDVTFSEAIDPATVTTSTFVLTNTSTSAVISAVVTYASNVVTVNPVSSLAATTQYTLTIRGGGTNPVVRDVAGNALAANAVVNFTTGSSDTTPPTVSVTSPLSGVTGVLAANDVTVTFSEAMLPSTINATTFTLVQTSNSASVGAVVSYAGLTATLNPTVNLSSNTQYTATITGATDLAGNALPAYSWNFTTEIIPFVEPLPPSLKITFDDNQVIDNTTVFKDSSTNRAHCISTLGFTPVIVPGKFGNGASFDGNDFITCPYTTQTDLENNFTISGWFKFNSTVTNRRTVIMKGALGGTNVFSLEPYNGYSAPNLRSHFGYKQAGFGYNALPANSVITDTNWHHMVVVFTNGASGIKLWVDGVLTTKTNTLLIEKSVASIWLGRGLGTTAGFNGIMDEVTFYGAALNDTQVQSIIDRQQ
jgi:hypothetical protein